ncbi:MAG: hypothetical protein ACYDGO_03510 [Smithellaceae bacterium]
MVERSGLWYVAVDGKTAQNAFKGFVLGSSLQFVAPNRLRALAVKEGKMGVEFFTYELETR